MNILFVDLDREWRGGQSQALLTLRGLQLRGHKIELLAPQDSPLAQRSKDFAIPVHQVPQTGMRAWTAKALHGLISAGHFDLVHLNEPHALTSAWLARAHHRLPLLLSRRIGFPLQQNFVSQSRYRAVSRFLANSEDVAKSLVTSGIDRARISIVNEGVEIPAPPSPDQRLNARKKWSVGDRDFLFGCVSVLVPEKGQRHLIEALPIARAIHPEAKLLLAGDGACRSELQTLAARLNQSDAVIFAGFVKDVPQVYAALDAFVFPSEFEGLGTALQSAMAASLPCISTKRGALGEVVDHERTALVAEPNADEFARAMLRLLVDENLRLRLGAAGKAEVEQRFSASMMVDNTLRIYEDVLMQRQKV